MNTFRLTILLLILCFVAIVLETTVVNFPFVFLISAVLLVFVKKIPSLIGAFLLGFVIDALRVSQFGVTALFLLGMIAFILLYEKYSGSDDMVISSFIIAVTCFLYAQFLSYSMNLVVIFFALASTSWYFINRFQKKGKLLL